MKAIKIILAIGIILSTASCYTQKNASKQVDKAYSRYEAVVAGKCGNWYPIRVDTVIGKPITKRDTTYVPGATVFVDCDSAIKNAKPGDNSTRVPAKCPDLPIIHDSISYPIYIVQENTAKLREAELKIKEVEGSGRMKNGIIGVVGALLAISLIANYILFKQVKDDRKNV